MDFSTLDKETIRKNAFLMTLLRGCISSYVLSTFFQTEFPITLDELLEEFGDEEIEIFYRDKESVNSILADCGIVEFETMNDLLETTLGSIEDIIFEEQYDMTSV